MEVAIHFPPVDRSFLPSALVSLTEAIAARDPDSVAHGALGGEYGYGAHYENDVFLIHPFCWCERDDCPWCLSCECEARYLAHDKEVDFDVWIDLPRDTRTTEVVKQCDRCLYGLEDAPNFWYKPTDARAWWYKYIGRDMKVSGDFPPDFLLRCLSAVNDTPSWAASRGCWETR